MSFVTGCNGPFKRGRGGINACGCNCKCCPPCCYGVVSVFFDCGGAQSPTNPAGCDFTVTPFQMAPPQQMPTFSNFPILSANGQFILGPTTCPSSVPCQTVCVPVKCGGNNCPCCCIEICDGNTLLSVGNGYVTAPSTVTVDGCLTFTVLINGLPPPVFVCDAEPICVTLAHDPDDPCCRCEPISVQPGCCPPTPGVAFTGLVAYQRRPLWKRKTDPETGKLKINPYTGKPIIILDKSELVRRKILERKKNLSRKHK